MARITCAFSNGSIEAHGSAPHGIVRVIMRQRSGRYREGISLDPDAARRLAERLLNAAARMDGLAAKQRAAARELHRPPASDLAPGQDHAPPGPTQFDPATGLPFKPAQPAPPTEPEHPRTSEPVRTCPGGC